MQGFDVNRFVEERSAAWGRLEHLLLRIEREGLASLELPTVREFGRLYRAVSNDLLRARSVHHLAARAKQIVRHRAIEPAELAHRG